MPSNNLLHTVQKIIVLASGAPGSEAFRSQLQGLYEANGNWQEVALVIDDYMNQLVPQHTNGVVGLIQTMAHNALGLNLTDAKAAKVVQDFKSAGVTTWSQLFTFVITKVEGTSAAVLDNRADSANAFTDLLTSLNKDADYNGSQALASAREWIQGIDATSNSQLAANESAQSLISRFVDGNVKSTVLDGYVAGATVFIDVNNDGVQNPGEPTTITDADGNFVFDGALPAGKLIASGGTDLATGLPFTGTMSAPSGAAVITPLTTLAQQMLESNPGASVSDVEEIIFTTFGVPRVDLSTYDPITSGLNPAATQEQKILAAKVQSATSQLVNVLSVGTSLVDNLVPGSSNGNKATLDTLIKTLTAAASTGKKVDLANPETLGTLFKSTALAAGAINGTSTAAQTTQVNKLATQAGESLQAINKMTQDSEAAFSSGATPSLVTAMSDLYKLQKLSQTTLSTAVKASTSGDLASVIADFSGNNLANKIVVVSGGSLNGSTPTNTGAITSVNGSAANNDTGGSGSAGGGVAPGTAVPSIALASDTGISSSDHITSNALVNVSGLISGATWEHSEDGGSSWTAGSGSSFFAGKGDGPRNVLVRQSDSGNTSAAASLNFTVDTIAATPGLVLSSDTGITSSDGITKVGRVNLGGLESGASFEYSTDGGSSWNAGSGSSFTVSGDGPKYVAVRQSDVAGNISIPNFKQGLSFVLDTSAPSTPTATYSDTGNASDGITANGTIYVSDLESAASFEYSTDGGSSWTAGSGSNFTLSGGGAKAVLVRQLDVAGNTSGEASLNFTLDTTAAAPVAVLISDTGHSASDGITSDGSIAVSGLESGATFEYLDTIASGLKKSTTDVWAAGSGSSFSVTGNGEHTVQVRQIDEAGNISASTAVNFSLDTTVAAPSLALIGTDPMTNDGTVNVSGLESGASFEYTTDGGSSWNAGSGSSFVLSGDGPKYVAVRQSDVAGNTSNNADLYFVLDTVAPSTPTAFYSDTGNTSDALTANGTIYVSDLESGASFQYSMDGGSSWNAGSGSYFVLSGDGAKAVLVRQLDVAGNTSDSVSLNFTLDTTAAIPAAVLMSDTGHSASDGITNDGTITVSGLESGATYEYSDAVANKNRSLSTVVWTTGSGNSFSVSGDYDHTVQVRQIDEAGNFSANAWLSFTLDTTVAAPLLALASDTGNASDALTSNGMVNINGLEFGAGFEYSTDSGSSWSAGSGSDFTVSGDGAKSVLVRQLDVAGNVSDSASLNFTLDTTVATPSLALLSDTGSSASDGITSVDTVVFSGQESGASFEYSEDGGSSWTTSRGAMQVTGDGSHTVLVRQSDLADNTSAQASLSFILDTTAPSSAPVLSYTDTGNSSDGITSNGTITVSGLESGARFEYSTNGGSSWNAGSGSSFALSGDGSKNVQVRQSDMAGNTSNAASLSFTLDTSLDKKIIPSTAPDAGADVRYYMRVNDTGSWLALDGIDMALRNSGSTHMGGGGGAGKTSFSDMTVTLGSTLALVELSAALASSQQLDKIEIEAYILADNKAGLQLVDEFQFTGGVLLTSLATAGTANTLSFNSAQYNTSHFSYDKSGSSSSTSTGWDIAANKSIAVSNPVADYVSSGKILAPQIGAGLNYYLHLDGADGWIKLEDFSLGMSNSGSMHMGGGAGAGKANFTDVSMTLGSNAQMIRLGSAATTGSHLGNAEIEAYSGDGPGARLVDEYRFDNLIVTALNTSNPLANTLDLNFASFTHSHVEQSSKGGELVSPASGWDIAQNIAVVGPRPQADALLSSIELIPSISPYAEVEYFMRVNDSDSWLALDAIDMELSNSGTTHMGAGGGAGKTNFSDMSVTLGSTRALVELSKALASSQQLNKVEIEAYIPGGKGGLQLVDEFQFTGGVLVTSLATAGGDNTLSFNSVQYSTSHLSYDQDGRSSSSSVGWDIAANKSIAAPNPVADYLSVGTILAPQITAGTALDYYLHLDGADGWIKLDHFSLGMSSSGTMHMGSGGQTGQANFTDVSLILGSSAEMVRLGSAATSGSHLANAEIEVYTRGLEPTLVDEYRFDNLIVTALNTSDPVANTLDLNFESFTHGHVDPGSKGSPAVSGWNAALNIEVGGPNPQANAIGAKLVPSVSAADVQYFMRVDDSGSWLALDSIDMDLSNNGSTHMGAGGGAGKTNFSDMSVTLGSTLALVEMSTALTKGRPLINKVEIEAYIPGGKGGVQLVDEFQFTGGVLVTSLATAGGTNTLSFNSAQYSTSHLAYDKAGQSSSTSTGWDIAANKSITVSSPVADYVSGGQILAPQIPADSELEYYLHLDGADGWLKLEGFSLGMSSGGTMHMGSGDRTGPAIGTDVSLFLGSNAQMARLGSAATSGRHLANAEIEVYTRGAEPMLVDEYRFENLIVTAINTSNPAGNTLDLNFESFTHGHVEISSKGSSPDIAVSGWNFADNIEVVGQAPQADVYF